MWSVRHRCCVFIVDLADWRINLAPIRHGAGSPWLMVVQQLQTVSARRSSQLQGLAHSVIPPLADAESPRHAQALVSAGGVAAEASG